MPVTTPAPPVAAEAMREIKPNSPMLERAVSEGIMREVSVFMSHWNFFQEINFYLKNKNLII
jgi:hypothetical protein